MSIKMKSFYLKEKEHLHRNNVLLEIGHFAGPNRIVTNDSIQTRIAGFSETRARKIGSHEFLLLFLLFRYLDNVLFQSLNKKQKNFSLLNFVSQ